MFVSTLCLQFERSCFWWRAPTAWQAPLLPGPTSSHGGHSSRQDTGQEDPHLFVVLKAFQSPKRVLSLASVLKVKLVIRCRVRKGHSPTTFQSDYGEDNALAHFFSVVWIIIHLLGSPRDWRPTLFFLCFWKLRAFLPPGLKCIHLLEHWCLEEGG